MPVFKKQKNISSKVVVINANCANVFEPPLISLYFLGGNNNNNNNNDNSGGSNGK